MIRETVRQIRPTRSLLHVVTVASSLDFLKGQARYVSEHGFDVHIVASPDHDLMSRFATTEGASAHEVPMSRTIAPLEDLRSLFRLWSLIARLRPDIVHAGTPKGGFLGMVAAALNRVPVRIYHIHGIRSMTATGWLKVVLQSTEWLACLLSTRVLCVSPSTREAAIAAHLCPAKKAVVLGSGSCNGVDALGRFDPGRDNRLPHADLRQHLKLPPTGLVLGFVGRVVRDKGIAELAVAWRDLAARFPDLYLVLVGPPEQGDPVSPEVLHDLENHPRVRFVAAVTETAPYYSLMDVVVLPSYREGLPNVLLEAAAMRLPTVATRVPGCTDAIVDGVTGTLVPPYSGQALAEAIAAYLHSPGLRRKHGAAGREHVLRDFDPEALWRKVLTLYEDEWQRHHPGTASARP